MISFVNAACVDTDGGEIFDTKGTVTADISGTSYDMEDYCLGESELKEYYCNGDSSSFTMKQCNCVDGACAGTGQYGYFWDVPNDEIESCSDSDNGKNYDDKGTITISADGHDYSLTDNCYSPGHTITEYYCEGGLPKLQNKLCDCQDGVCYQEPEPVSECSETDDGKDYYEKGVATWTQYYDGDNGVGTDTCMDSQKLKEFFCTDLNQGDVTTYTCPYGCEDGVCLDEEIIEESVNECDDSDGGKDYYEKGYTQCLNGHCTLTWDYCADSSSDLPGKTTGKYLYEGFCNSADDPQLKFYQCPYGCVNGACLKEEVKIEIKSGPRVMGSSSARLHLIEWGDFQCPFCKRYFDDTLPQIKTKFIDTGMVKYEFRHYPLSFHPDAHRAAQAAECADDQGKFWEMHDIMFNNQDNLNLNGLVEMADEIQIHEGVFEDCLTSQKYEDEVEDQMSDGTKQGITGTPGFLLIYTDKNGKETKVQIKGAQPFAKFEELIESAWRKEVYEEPGTTPGVPEQNLGEVSIDKDPYMGDINAKVAIVEFADFECPFCARAHPTVKRIQNKYVKTGKVLFVYRDFPLSFHKNAKDAAVASECAFNQPNYYWKFHDELFSNQDKLGESLYVEIADEIGMDLDKFVDCYEDYNYESDVDSDFKAGQVAGVSGTPTFFIGRLYGDTVKGEKLVGAQPYENFEDVIERYLDSDDVPDDEFCGDGICQINEKRYCNLDCPVYDDKPELKCVDGDSLYFECTDGEKLSWCICVDNDWECIDNPQKSCDIQEGKCDGCIYADSCYPYGQRMQVGDDNKYCSISGDLLIQKADESSCQNSHECYSNQCSNGKCIDLEKELEETKSLMRRILDFLSRIFS